MYISKMNSVPARTDEQYRAQFILEEKTQKKESVDPYYISLYIEIVADEGFCRLGTFTLNAD